jgi:hypothetical protein
MNKKPHLELIRLLLTRLERISADSYWAHRASGIRGSLLKALETLENGQPVQTGRLERLIASGYRILEGAVREKRGWKETRE